MTGKPWNLGAGLVYLGPEQTRNPPGGEASHGTNPQAAAQHNDSTVGKLNRRVDLAPRECDTQKIQSHKIDKPGVVIDFTRQLPSRFL